MPGVVLSSNQGSPYRAPGMANEEDDDARARARARRGDRDAFGRLIRRHQRHRNASSPYSAQPGNPAALENQSIVHDDIGDLRSS